MTFRKTWHASDAARFAIFVLAAPIPLVVALFASFAMGPQVLIPVAILRLIIAGIATIATVVAIVSTIPILRKRHAIEALEFRVCPRSGFSLSGLPNDGICPECGTPFSQRRLIQF